MRWPLFPRIGVLACVFSAAFLLPAQQASAQRASQQDNQSLSAAIAEAKRSPFHVRDDVSGSVTPGTEPAVSGTNLLVGGQETGDEMPSDGPSAKRVFLATAIAAPVANVVGLALVWGGGWTDADGESRWDDMAALSGVGIALLGPPIAAQLVGEALVAPCWGRWWGRAWES